jgi:hypothetical protein
VEESPRGRRAHGPGGAFENCPTALCTVRLEAPSIEGSVGRWAWSCDVIRERAERVTRFEVGVGVGVPPCLFAFAGARSVALSRLSE